MACKINLKGQKFGRLEVLDEATKQDKNGCYLHKCVCECGNITYATSTSLRRGHKRSCGCLMRERIGNMRRTHGQSQGNLYHLYYNIKSRCNNPNSRFYEHYGGRGISLCDEWQTWENFYNWAIENGYKKGLTIDRIDVNGNYEPANCRWITHAEQMRNTRKTRYLTYKGVSKPLKTWCEECGVCFNTASVRFTRGWTNPHEILFGRMKGELNNG